tara:strand:+ start:462 stop:611 length:150 start_codon:yes stop_codon:yes gene_type:complete
MDKFSEKSIAEMDLETMEPFILDIVKYSNQLVDKVNELEDRILILEEGV